MAERRDIVLLGKALGAIATVAAVGTLSPSAVADGGIPRALEGGAVVVVQRARRT